MTRKFIVLLRSAWSSLCGNSTGITSTHSWKMVGSSMLLPCSSRWCVRCVKTSWSFPSRGATRPPLRVCIGRHLDLTTHDSASSISFRAMCCFKWLRSKTRKKLLLHQNVSVPGDPAQDRHGWNKFRNDSLACSCLSTTDDSVQIIFKRTGRKLDVGLRARCACYSVFERLSHHGMAASVRDGRLSPRHLRGRWRTQCTDSPELVLLQ